MPKIKSPISQAERDYNKRYEPETQKGYQTSVLKAKENRKFLPDNYTLSFIRRIQENLIYGIPLSEAQADFLAELYDKYSE